MNQEQFVAAHFHELFGLVADAVTAGRHGAELSVWLSMARAKIHKELTLIYAELQPPARNGVAAPPTRKP